MTGVWILSECFRQWALPLRPGWSIRQHWTLARPYAVASAELSAIDVQIVIRQAGTEQDWAVFVNAAEDAISREHTSRRASRMM